MLVLNTTYLPDIKVESIQHACEYYNTSDLI